MRKVFPDMGMLCHVWAQQNQPDGRHGKGTGYFEGPAVYSYGSHYLLGFIMPATDKRPAVALINSHRYSVTTTRHIGDARAATRHMTQVSVPDLTKLRYELERIADNYERFAAYNEGDAQREKVAAMRKADRGALIRHFEANAHDYSDESAVALAKLFGLTPAAPRKAKAARVKNDAKEKASRAKFLLERRIERAKNVAAMSDSEFRATFPRDSQYDNSPLTDFATELTRIHRAAKAAGLSDKRLKALWARVIEARAHAAGVDDRLEASRRHRLASEIRAWRDGMRREKTPPNAYDYERRGCAAIARALDSAWEQYRADSAAYEAKQQAAALAAFDAWREGKGERPAVVTWLTPENQAIVTADKKRTQMAEWRAGVAGVQCPIRTDPHSGSALLRVKDGELQTSLNASVPLAHAIRVFQFAKLCRENQTHWHRNGKTIRVGHFQVDEVDSFGNFKAGCHFIAWSEIEIAAVQAGVMATPAADVALEPSR